VATISKWERGERFPTGKNFELLAGYTGQCCANCCAPSPANATTTAAPQKNPRAADAPAAPFYKE
jgi:hypothetical protein